MYIKKLYLKNFRNLDEVSINLSENVNIIYGFNASGKTNIVESIGFLSNFKSFRTSKTKELINFDCNDFHIECEFVNDRDYKLKYDFLQPNKHQISLNAVKYKSKNELLGKIKTIIFCPDDLFLIKSSPEIRRKFLNDTLVQFRPKYAKLISDYSKYLKQKLHVLKSEDSYMKDLVFDYNEALARLSAEISFMRANFLITLEKDAKIVYNDISGSLENLEILYNTKLTNPSLSISQNYEEYVEIFKNYHKNELMAKSCLVGCHKDDISFFINGNNAREYASQGQIRSVVLSLKFAVKELFLKDTNSMPILILDDVLSELDEKRQDYVLNQIKTGQIIITSPQKIGLDGNFINIQNGKILE